MRPDENKKRHIVVCGKGGSDQVQADWNQTDTEQPDYIKNKPSLATVATSGSYNDLTDKPTIPTQVQADWNETDTADPSYIQNKPTILTQWFGTQAEYDLIDPKDPNVIYNIEGSDNVQADWNQTDTTADDYIKNKPTIPAAQVNSDWNAVSGVAQILNKPTIPAAQVNSDWNAVSGVAEILNKPAIPANTSDLTNNSGFITISDVPAQEQADWNQSDTTAVDFIKNKPTIPTVPAMATETLTFTLQGGITKTVEFYTVPNYFYVEDVSGSDNTLSIIKSSASAPDVEVFCSTDKANWTSIGTTTEGITATVPANSKLYLKANTNAWGTSSSNYNKIYCSNNYNVGGDIMSLLNSDNFENTILTVNYSFVHLFGSSKKLISASNLILPSNTIRNCYYNMFFDCTSLTTAPALPATTVAYECYKEMFKFCTALTTAPALPATTLGLYCYQQMFYSCPSLTTAPVLPATTLTQGCYSGMFQGCSSLNSVTTYAQDISATNCLMNWLDTVSATGDFYNLGGVTYTSGASGIPSGWTEHNSL